jgi:hypothetical protein
MVAPLYQQTKALHLLRARQLTSFTVASSTSILILFGWFCLSNELKMDFMTKMPLHTAAVSLSQNKQTSRQSPVRKLQLEEAVAAPHDSYFAGRIEMACVENNVHGSFSYNCTVEMAVRPTCKLCGMSTTEPHDLPMIHSHAFLTLLVTVSRGPDPHSLSAPLQYQMRSKVRDEEPTVAARIKMDRYHA